MSLQAVRRPVPRAGRRRNLYPLFFLAPYLFGLVAFNLLPVVFTLGISFTKWNGFSEMSFVGFNNYVHLLTRDTRFWGSLGNTFVLMALSIPVTLFLALVFGYLLTGRQLYGKRVFQTALFTPYITTPVAVGIIFALLFDQRYGLVNQLLSVFELSGAPIYWLGQPWSARVVLAIMLIWRYLGYDTVLFMAGMSMISEEVYDAARVDGANGLQVFFRITLPMLKGILIFVVITSMIGGFQLFDEPSLLFNGGFSGSFPYGGPKKSCLTLSMFFYEESYKNLNYGFGAAIAYGMFLVISAFSFLSMRLMTGGKQND